MIFDKKVRNLSSIEEGDGNVRYPVSRLTSERKENERTNNLDAGAGDDALTLFTQRPYPWYQKTSTLIASSENEPINLDGL